MSPALTSPSMVALSKPCETPCKRALGRRQASGTAIGTGRRSVVRRLSCPLAVAARPPHVG
jgi:hypothetical protein